MSGTRIAPALLALALSMCLTSGADARKGRSWHFFDRSGYSNHSGGAIGDVTDRLVRGCLQQAAAFQNWPFDDIAVIVRPNDVQRGALDALRSSAAAAAQRLSAECPQDQPAPPGTRLEAVLQAIDAATSAFSGIEPSLQAFYAALDDEQKARLVRDLTLPGSHAKKHEHRHRRKNDPPRADAGSTWTGICERLAGALRGWPVREIERGVGLSESQRVALHDLVGSSRKAADTLAGTCPAETALTAPVRMATMRERLSAVRQATVAIHPAFTQFYEALDQGQKLRFAGVR